MGLLDALFQGSQGGGLLDFLKNNALNQPMSGMPQGDQAQYGQMPMGAMAQAPIMAQMPQQMQAAQPQMQQVPQQPPPVIQSQQPQQQGATPPAFLQPPSSGGFGGAARGMMANMQGGPLGMIAGALGGAMGMGQGSAQDVQRQNLKAQYDALVPILIQAGKTPQQAASLAMLSVMNPKAAETILPENLSNKEQFKTLKDAMGVEHPAFVNPVDQTINGKTVDEYNKQSGSGAGLGDMNKSGPEYLATLPKQVQGTVKGMLDGTIQPPSSFAAAKPYWQSMLAAAKNADPAFDETKWGSRHTMANQLALSGNSTMGGILSNGESSFKHLAEYTKSAADQGNVSHNFPLGGAIAHAQNYISNSGGGSDVLGKVKAINDNLGHYGQESTKFYAGTGGGVEERMNALKEMNPLSTSSEEAAAYAEKEKGLMLDRLNTKFDEIRNIYGEEQGNKIIAKHMPEIQQNIAAIDANVAKLRGGASAAPSAKPLPKPGDMQGGFRFKGGNPGDKANWEPVS